MPTLSMQDSLRPARAAGFGPAAARLLAGRLRDAARESALFLDVDGTLLDIAGRPDAVVVPAQLPQTLAVLHDRLGGALALVSGRPVGELDRLFAPLRLPVAGVHGAHWRLRPGGKIAQATSATPDPAVRARLLALARDHPGVLVEDKGCSLALHYRSAPAARAALAAALEELLPGAANLRLLPGKMVYEVVAGGLDKSAALRRFLDHAPFAGRSPVYLGDDVTDEPALALCARLGGLALAVGEARGGAAAVFDDPAAVREALYALAEAPR